jgi:hypothetical protein
MSGEGLSRLILGQCKFIHNQQQINHCRLSISEVLLYDVLFLTFRKIESRPQAVEKSPAKSRFQRESSHRRRLTSEGMLDLFSGLNLEDRILLSTITRTSGDIFYVDSSKPYNGQYLSSAYVSYEFTNTDGAAYSNVYAKISNFTGGQISLASGASDTYQLGAVNNNANDTAFFYLTSNTLTTNTVAQSHTVTFYDGAPSNNKPIVSQSFTINAQYDLIAAAANKITGATLNPTNPVLGDTITVTLQGQTGTIGTGYAASYAMY